MQRKTAVGLTSTRLWLGSRTAFNLIISRPPHSPGPMSLGNNSMTAISVNRWSQSLNALVTFAVSKPGPAASAKVCGSGQTSGRGCGKGTLAMSAVAGPAAFFEGARSVCPAFDFALIRRKARELSLRRCAFRPCDWRCDPWDRTTSSVDRACAAAHAYVVTISTTTAGSQSWTVMRAK